MKGRALLPAGSAAEGPHSTISGIEKPKSGTKKQIYTQVWEEEYVFDDSNLMSFISKLRKKIEPDSEHPSYILTVRGVGYRFNREA